MTKEELVSEAKDLFQEEYQFAVDLAEFYAASRCAEMAEEIKQYFVSEPIEGELPNIQDAYFLQELDVIAAKYTLQEVKEVK